MSRLERGNHFLGGFGTENYLEDYNLGKGRDKSPYTNISENEHQYKVELSIPGFEKKDLSLTLDNSKIIIEGRKEDGKPGSDREEYWQQEFQKRRFKSSFRLPEDVRQKEIKATCKNGLLEIILPKAKSGQKVPSVIRVN